MPDYTIKIKSDVVLDQAGLDRLEDAVYDVLTKEKGGSTAMSDEWTGVNDVRATFD